MEPACEEAAELGAEHAVVRPFSGAPLLFAGALGGLVLWYAAFPSMYYLAWLFAVAGLWTLVLAAPVLSGLVSSAWHRARGRSVELSWSGSGLLLGWLLAITVSIGLELPLRATFSLARSGLETQLADYRASQRLGQQRGRWAGPFYVDRVEPGRCDATRTLFWLENDIESAFVHAPGGIEGLCYNSGHAGHLAGDWYWMTED